MAKKKNDYNPEDIRFPDQTITSSELVHEMKTSYIEYAMSVIVGRALPDVRDGLKPVHRRILYAMYEDGLTKDKAYRKSVTAVGDVLGRYHPHGDASVYDALVRLAQDFSMRYPLIDGHGNFGSVDGDPPAAYRYTEARMARIADEMLRDIDKETVDWDPNFDETRKEPRVLPSRFPNLLVNGSSGIAVGMATNIPPHNLREVIDAAVCVMDKPDATLEDLMEHVKGPDFPTRGIIMGKRGIRLAYATGRGHITVRARTEFEEYGPNKDRTRIIVTELPYQVNKRQLIASIADQVHEKKLEGIHDMRDESDRKGMRIVIELKKEANPQVVLNHLFTQSQMQTTFAVNMLALVNNQTQPKILSLKHILEEYIAFQKDLLLRRTRYDLRKAKERAHLLEGLLIAQENIDEVIQIIRNSYDNAKENLMARFGLSEVQASAILEMRLKALQGLEEDKLRAEYKELEEKIAWYNELLESDEKLSGLLRQELLEIRDKFGDDRLTEICEIEDEIDDEDLIEEKTCVFTFTRHGYIKRQPEDVYKVQKRGGVGVSAMTTKEDDFAIKMFVGSTHDSIFFFTSKGRVFRRKGYEIPESSRQSMGMNIVNLLDLEEGETVTSMIPSKVYNEDFVLTMVTLRGVTKRCSLGAYKHLRRGGLIAIDLDEGDELISVLLTEGDSNIMIATHKGYAITYKEDDIRVMGRVARGVRGIRLTEGDYVIGAVVSEEGKQILTVTENGYGKRSDPGSFSIQRRGGKGVRCHKVNEKTGPVANIRSVSEDEDAVIISLDGIIIRMKITDIPVYGRTSGGVRVMRFREEDDRIVNVAPLPASSDTESVKLEADEEAEAEVETEEVETEEEELEEEVEETEETEETSENEDNE